MSAPASTIKPEAISLIRYSTFEEIKGDKNPGERQRAINNATADRYGLHIAKEIKVIETVPPKRNAARVMNRRSEI